MHGNFRPMQQRQRPPRRSRQGLVALLLVLLASGAGYRYGWLTTHESSAPAQSAEVPPVPVTLASVEMGPFNLMQGGLGTAQAYNTVQVRTRVDGEIQKIAFKEGQVVKKGDVLAEVDPRPYRATLDQVVAKKTQDDANLKNAKLDLDRYTKLGDYSSRKQLDTQTAQVNQLSAQVAADQAAIDNAQTQLGYATIRSPIDGVTGFRQVDIGNIVNASAQTQNAIVVITQVEPIFVVFTAPEERLPTITAALAKGTVPVEAWSTDGSTKLSEGRLDLVNNQVDTATGTIRLKAAFANTDHALWPGLSVSTKMRLGTVAEAVTIPDDAVQHGPNGLYTFVVDDTNKARQQLIKVAGSSEGRTRVLEGLNSGERVIKDGQVRVQPGTLVAETATPEPPQDAAQAARFGSEQDGGKRAQR